MPSFLVSCFICGINMPLYEFSGVSGWLDLQRVLLDWLSILRLFDLLQFTTKVTSMIR